MEKLIAITASLPETSKARHKLTCTIVDTLWDSLQHPPLSYLGDKFQYRTPDGSYNVGLPGLSSPWLTFFTNHQILECSQS